MRLELDPRHTDRTVLGWDWLEPISYGYDHKGFLQSILCKAPFSDGTVMLVDIIEPEISEDLMMYYNIAKAKGGKQ